MRTSRFRLLLPLALVAAACGGAEEELDAETLAVECADKCDGLGQIKSLLKDAKKLDLGDLMAHGSTFATQKVNDALSLGVADLEFQPTVAYALPARAQGDLTLKNIETLVTGLGARFGETELTTVVNALRRDHLKSSGDEVFAESGFKLRAGFAHGWNFAAGGLGASATVGFDANAALEGRVIAPFEKERDAFSSAPLAALTNTRGFVVPRTVAEVKAMKPGELFALRGAGSLGANLGAGVPLLVASPAAFLSYSLVFSAALRAHLSGQLDVQLVRLAGDEAVLDVGIEAAAVRSAQLALNDGWGVSGIPSVPSGVSVGGVKLDLAKLADNALSKQLNSKLRIVSARAESTGKQTRLSVARFRFKLSKEDGELAAALAQALRADVRLAQALATRAHPGVVAEFDLFRSGASSLSHAGVDLLGMSFFTTKELSEGSAVVQTPGGARTLLFESLHKESGWFFSTHGYTRVALSGLAFDAKKPGAPKGEANLFIQLLDGDDYLEREKLVDGLDGLLLGLGGATPHAELAKHGNELERYVDDRCPERSRTSDDCYEEALTDARVTQLRSTAMGSFRNATVSRTAAEKALLDAAASLRIAAQAAVDPANALGGPPGSLVLDYRLDNGALAQILMGSTGKQFRAALETYLGVVKVDRALDPAKVAQARAQVISKAAGDLQKMEQAFTTRANNYKSLVGAEKAVIRGLGTIGASALELRFAVDSSNRAKYEDASLQSLAPARAREAAQLFDELVKLADDVGSRPEQVVSYGLMSLATPKRLDVRLDVKLTLEDSWSRKFTHYRAAGYAGFDQYVRGELVAPIDGGGLFSLDALKNVD